MSGGEHESVAEQHGQRRHQTQGVEVVAAAIDQSGERRTTGTERSHATNATARVDIVSDTGTGTLSFPHDHPAAQHSAIPGKWPRWPRYATDVAAAGRVGRARRGIAPG